MAKAGSDPVFDLLVLPTVGVLAIYALYKLFSQPDRGLLDSNAASTTSPQLASGLASSLTGARGAAPPPRQTPGRPAAPMAPTQGTPPRPPPPDRRAIPGLPMAPILPYYPGWKFPQDGSSGQGGGNGGGGGSPPPETSTSFYGSPRPLPKRPSQIQTPCQECTCFVGGVEVPNGTLVTIVGYPRWGGSSLQPILEYFITWGGGEYSGWIDANCLPS
ncbi:MAG: hypothetical protein ACYDH4_10645 [Candidatus Cryosericum sp.]